jgi:hypothetical protein
MVPGQPGEIKQDLNQKITKNKRSMCGASGKALA